MNGPFNAEKFEELKLKEEKLGCRSCGSLQFTMIQADRVGGGTYVRANCAECKAYFQFIPQGGRKWERAVGVETLMPFGKHKGTKIGDLPGEYLLWGADNLQSESFRKAFSEALRTRA